MSRPPIKRVVVLGAGTMGAQIAAHAANAGFDALLLDLTADIARDGLKRAAALKPDPFFTRELAAKIELGGFDRDLSRLREADWILEAVVEQSDIKRALLEKVDAHRRLGSIVSSNTSGIPVGSLAEGRSGDFKRHWLGTHFFNPPRYLRLLEIIPTPATDPEVVEVVTAIADRRLGKGVVIAKDTPCFIANHIGLYSVMQTIRLLESGRYTIEEIDAITGPAIGRPKSATFRTMDIAGLDVLGHVARNLAEHLIDPDARQAFVLPPIVQKLIDRGSIGEKAGEGFYKRTRTPGEDTEILTLDPSTMSYRPRQAVQLTALERARSIQDIRERMQVLYRADDKVGEFLRGSLGPTLDYAARVAPEIAYSIDDVDRAMRWGYGWELGPFEISDAIGDCPRFRERALPPAGADLQILRSAKERSRVIASNAGANLIDLDDGVLALEFQSKLNIIGGDTIEMVHRALKEAAGGFKAVVIGNDAADFSAGANLMLVLLEARDGNWDELDLMIRSFQQATRAIRYADVPVIVAPAGRVLGGGCEVLLHADRVQASAESYIGLVETSVGLIPAGGGTKEMLARASAGAVGSRADLLPYAQSVFETLGFARVSSSAADARTLGYLRPYDGVTMNRERLMADAKTLAIDRVREGYQPPERQTAIPVGGESVLAALKLGVHLARRAGRITEHDVEVGHALAHVIAGGSLPHQTTVDEDYLLDLEREAFLKLCGEKKTLERIQYTLKTGKPLRN